MYESVASEESKYSMLLAYKAPYGKNVRLDPRTVTLMQYMLTTPTGSSCIPLSSTHKLADGVRSALVREVLLCNAFGTNKTDPWSAKLNAVQNNLKDALKHHERMCSDPVAYVNFVIGTTYLSPLEVTYCIDAWLWRTTYRDRTLLTCPSNNMG